MNPLDLLNPKSYKYTEKDWIVEYGCVVTDFVTESHSVMDEIGVMREWAYEWFEDLVKAIRQDNIVKSKADLSDSLLSGAEEAIEEVNQLVEEVKRLREDYENMSEVLRENGRDICRHCRVIYRDNDMDHPHYESLHPWHMDGMCMKEMKKND